MRKRALITGITGQDGSYLAEFLLEQGYDVVGMVRRTSTVNFERIAHIQDQLTLVAGDLLDEVSLIGILREHRPAEVYNLAAQSFVQTSWGQPVLTGETTALGVTRLLDAIRIVDPGIRFYQASSSEMFGKVHEVPQTETTPFYPRSPYGVAKVYGHWITVNYRESYGLHASSGMLFNHESPRRGLEFVTRKVTHAVARIVSGLTDKVSLGNLESQRDWGFAGDYVRAMWLMVQRDEPDDFVVATGVTHSVRELCDIAFAHAGLDWQEHVVVDEKFLRPAEVDLLIGDANKARTVLGWHETVDFAALVGMMVDADVQLLAAGAEPEHAVDATALAPHATIAADPLGLLVAFGAGMLSFLSPCVLPLVPGYVSMVSGLSAAEIDAGQRRARSALLRGVLGFVAGFTVVFTALGAAASGLGHLLLDHQRGLDIVAGVLVVLFGVWMLGIGTPRLFLRERRFHPRPSCLGAWAPPVMGMAFAFGWTPCIGPVLGGVLGLAAARATLASGIVLLVAYSLGLGVPFLATALAFGRLTSLVARVRRRLWVVDATSGALLVAFGVLLLTGNLHWLSSVAADVLRGVGLGRLTVS